MKFMLSRLIHRQVAELVAVNGCAYLGDEESVAKVEKRPCRKPGGLAELEVWLPPYSREKTFTGRVVTVGRRTFQRFRQTSPGFGCALDDLDSVI